uniref:Uncharacterized protein AlNc14C7G940 n=1 Tax=Albugo laibachii Nc14 TaxID=890382 RepID=F0W1H2_9STRA|nr:conserved hypothetical protein [Albugo laibachii Nc14]|eukprot:CCA14901.1 conserved hypothetical protein [Albugo laibachii Nc14]
MLSVSNIEKASSRHAKASTCTCCKLKLSTPIVTIYHCGACQQIVCASCSLYYQRVPKLGHDRPVRVCRSCKCVFQSQSPGDVTTCGDDLDTSILGAALEILASHSNQKHVKVSYRFFVQSEAVNWLVDARVAESRSTASSLFLYLVEEEFVLAKPWSGSIRTAFYYLSDDPCSKSIPYEYESGIITEINKCSNCFLTYLESLNRTPGFCSIDCKTNALIKEDDSARIAQFCSQ